ncbi:hypothetical protein MHU86_5438 [Fragilaria crotonensis]|nr:hypothetical protein MHU86_5438 [Fragilaria crotonensis]
MLFRPDDSNDDVTTKERASAIFKNVIGHEEDEQDSDLQMDSYRMIIKNPVQFQLVVDYVSAGASFRMASRIVQMMRNRTGLASIVRASEDKVTSFLDGMCSESSEVLRSNGINT